MGPNAYNGPTVKYEVNKTYHVTINYDDDQKTTSMKVKDWLTGTEDLAAIYPDTAENLNGMNRVYTGSKGDYGMMGIYEEGNIYTVCDHLTSGGHNHINRCYQRTGNDNYPSKNISTPKLTTAVPASYPTNTPTYLLRCLLLLRLCIIGLCAGVLAGKKQN